MTMVHEGPDDPDGPPSWSTSSVLPGEEKQLKASGDERSLPGQAGPGFEGR